MSLDDIDREIFEDRRQKEFLIDRFGKIHRYEKEFDGDTGTCIHYEIAHRLFPNVEYPKDFVWNMGWLIIGSHAGKSCKFKLNQAQLNALDKIEIIEE